MTHHYIKVHIEGPVASLVFNRPNVLNAFHNEAMDECVAALKELDDDQPDASGSAITIARPPTADHSARIPQEPQ